MAIKLINNFKLKPFELRKNMKIYIKLTSQLSVRRFIAFFMG